MTPLERVARGAKDGDTINVTVTQADLRPVELWARDDAVDGVHYATVETDGTLTVHDQAVYERERGVGQENA